jgi:hypothetical protein
MDTYQRQFSQVAIGNRQHDTEIRGLAGSLLHTGELRCPTG